MDLPCLSPAEHISGIVLNYVSGIKYKLIIVINFVTNTADVVAGFMNEVVIGIAWLLIDISGARRT